MARDAVQQQPSHLSEYFWIFLFIYMIFFVTGVDILAGEKIPFFLSLAFSCLRFCFGIDLESDQFHKTG